MIEIGVKITSEQNTATVEIETDTDGCTTEKPIRDALLMSISETMLRLSSQKKKMLLIERNFSAEQLAGGKR